MEKWDGPNAHLVDFADSMNARVLVSLEGESAPLEIATKELTHHKIPLIEGRFLPDGSIGFTRTGLSWSC